MIEILTSDWSRPSKETFEEVQFFSKDGNYQRGIDWYMDFFPPVHNNSSEVVLFEKSATYFDGDQVPMRVSRLLPHSKVSSDWSMLLTSDWLRWWQYCWSRV